MVPCAAVMLTMAAVAPTGMPPGRSRSRTVWLPLGRRVVWFVASAYPWPARLSNARTGAARALKRSVAGTLGAELGPYQPVTSTMTWLLPAALNTRTLLMEPTVAVTCWATVWPARKFRFEVVLAVASGCTVRCAFAVGPVTVTLRATATASAGTPATPRTGTWRNWPGPTGAPRIGSSASPTWPGAGVVEAHRVHRREGQRRRRGGAAGRAHGQATGAEVVVSADGPGVEGTALEQLLELGDVEAGVGAEQQRGRPGDVGRGGGGAREPVDAAGGRAVDAARRGVGTGDVGLDPAVDGRAPAGVVLEGAVEEAVRPHGHGRLRRGRLDHARCGDGLEPVGVAVEVEVHPRRATAEVPVDVHLVARDGAAAAFEHDHLVGRDGGALDVLAPAEPVVRAARVVHVDVEVRAGAGPLVPGDGEAGGTRERHREVQRPVRGDVHRVLAVAADGVGVEVGVAVVPG